MSTKNSERLEDEHRMSDYGQVYTILLRDNEYLGIRFGPCEIQGTLSMIITKISDNPSRSIFVDKHVGVGDRVLSIDGFGISSVESAISYIEESPRPILIAMHQDCLI